MAGSRTLRLELLAVDKGFARGFRGAESTVDKFQRRLTRTGDTLSRTVTPAVTALGVAAFNSASKQATAFSSLNTVYGDSADRVLAFGETAADSYGLSETEVASLAAVTGAQLKNLGFSHEEAADTSLRLQQRSADLAAQFGGPTSQAVEAFSALLRGERDPIERYGISVKQADINARLAEEGLSGLEGEARKAAEAQAALDIAFEQSADSAGFFAANTDNAAVSIAQARAQLDNALADLGQSLTPIVADLAGNVENAAEAFTSLPGPVQDAVVRFGALAAITGPVLSGLGRLIGVLRAMPAAFGPVGAALAGLAAAVTFVTNEYRENERQAEQYLSTLDEVTGATTEATEAMVAQNLVQEDLGPSLDLLGLSYGDLVGYLTGSEEATRNVEEAMDRATEASLRQEEGSRELAGAALEVEQAVADEGKALRDAAEDADEKREADRAAAEAAARARGEYVDLEQALEDGLTPAMYYAQIQTEETTEASEDAAGAAEDEAAAVSDLTRQLQNRARAQEEALDPVLRAIRADRDAQEAQEAYNAAVDEFGPTSKEARDATLDLVEAELRADSAAAGAASSQGEFDRRVRDVTSSVKVQEGSIEGLRSDLDRLNGRRITYSVQGRATFSGPLYSDSGGAVFNAGRATALHTGGVVEHNFPGPRRRYNERLALLEVGEEVVTADDPRHVDNLGSARRINGQGYRGGTIQNITINVTGGMMDPEGVARAVQRAMRDSAGRAGAFA